MPYSIHLLLALATLPVAQSGKVAGEGGSIEDDYREVMEPALERVRRLVEEFRRQRVTPDAAYEFEQQLQEELRELGRHVVQQAYNQLEPAVDSLPKHVWFEASEYTRLNVKTAQNAWTLFGQIRLGRVGYRPTTKTGDATPFSLALRLGPGRGDTPAVGER